MAVRMNIIRKRREIRHELTPSQNYLLDDIMLGTINDWDSSNQFDLEELANGLGYKSTDKLYLMLKQLANKKIIIRKPTKYPGLEILGLNPEFFGQVLIDHQNALEKNRSLKIVVDNSQDKLTDHKEITYEPKASNLRTVSDQLTNSKLLSTQPIENIEQNFPLDSYRCEQISSEAKELIAHEERKREYMPKGSESIYEKIERWKQGKVG